jgi:V/A-type H+-transporting ATPase subunit I
MAITPINQVTLYGIADQKEAVLDGLQSLGCVHLVNLTPETGGGRPAPGFSVEAHEAMHYLRTCSIVRRPVIDSKDFDSDAVEQEALMIRQREQELQDEHDFALKAIDALEPWGEFLLPQEEELGGAQLWFYVMPHQQMKLLGQKESSKELGFVWQSVARDERFDYVVVVDANEPQGMPVSPENLDSRSLSQLTEHVEKVEFELEDLHWRRVELTRWCSLLAHSMAKADDRAVLEHAGQQTWDESRVFAVQGWAPRRVVPRLEEFAREHALALSVKEPEPEDNPPTMLDNPELLAGGQDTVTFYMTPGYRTWDPSMVVFFSFTIFFAMILADAGYALMLSALLLLMWRKLGRTRPGLRLRNLFLAVVLASIAYGVMVGSYFGVSPTAGSLLASWKMLDVMDQGTMMRLSIVIGALHLILANLVTAWRLRDSLRALAPLGWIGMILGGLIAGFEMAGDDPHRFLLSIDIGLLAAGAGVILLFSSQRPLAFGRISDLGWRLFDGLIGLTGISKAFGDVLSYLRLFALGLASSQLAITFNEMASTSAKSRGVGLLAAALILVFGHGLNFVLAVMGGVVHGLRLNCIEFFSWSLPEEGYPFQAFCKKASQ